MIPKVGSTIIMRGDLARVKDDGVTQGGSAQIPMEYRVTEKSKKSPFFTATVTQSTPEQVTLKETYFSTGPGGGSGTVSFTAEGKFIEPPKGPPVPIFYRLSADDFEQVFESLVVPQVPAPVNKPAETASAKKSLGDQVMGVVNKVLRRK